METSHDRQDRAEAIIQALDLAEHVERAEEAGLDERRARRVRGALAQESDEAVDQDQTEGFDQP